MEQIVNGMKLLREQYPGDFIPYNLAELFRGCEKLEKSTWTWTHDLYHRVHTEWQPLLSGVHPIMMEKFAKAGEGGGVHAHPPFIIVTIRYKVAVYAPAEWADTLTLFHLYQSEVGGRLISSANR